MLWESHAISGPLIYTLCYPVAHRTVSLFHGHVDTATQNGSIKADMVCWDALCSEDYLCYLSPADVDICVHDSELCVSFLKVYLTTVLSTNQLQNKSLLEKLMLFPRFVAGMGSYHFGQVDAGSELHSLPKSHPRWRSLRDKASLTELIPEHFHSLEMNGASCTRLFPSDLTSDKQNSSKAEEKMQRSLR